MAGVFTNQHVDYDGDGDDDVVAVVADAAAAAGKPAAIDAAAAAAAGKSGHENYSEWGSIVHSRMKKNEEQNEKALGFLANQIPQQTYQ